MATIIVFSGSGATAGDTTAPVVTPGQSFPIGVSSPVATVVGTVLATDNVGVTSFAITAGNTGGAFAIDSSGQITVAAALVAGNYNLTITASDLAGNTSTPEIVVVVVSAALGFKSITNPRTSYSASLPWQPPTTVTPLPAAIVPTGSGVERLVTNEAEWNAAVAAAGPGDVIRITQTINASTGLNYRGTKYGITGGVAASGTAANPIVLCADPGAFINVGDNTNGESCLDVQNADHIWLVGINVQNGTFGIRVQNCEGTATDPIRIAHCTIQDMGDSGLSNAGWFQDISLSGGTPPAGSGNERGFSGYIIQEGNTFQRMGRWRTQFGEGSYLGVGSFPSWFGYAHHVCIRYNTYEEYTADAVDIKPGCQQIYFHDNYLFNGGAHFGASIGGHYMAAGAPRPAYANGRDPEIWIESNRVYGHNTVIPVPSSAPWPGYHGVNGIRWAFNLIWTWDQTQEAVRLRCEEAEASYESSVTDHFVCNTLWSGNGFVNAGAGTGGGFTGPVANPPVQEGNLVATGKTGAQFTAAASAFSGSVPAVGATGLADSGSGPGSAFQLDAAHGLGTAGDVSARTFLFDGEDIYGTVANLAAPLPGAFQATA